MASSDAFSSAPIAATPLSVAPLTSSSFESKRDSRPVASSSASDVQASVPLVSYDSKEGLSTPEGSPPKDDAPKFSDPVEEIDYLMDHPPNQEVVINRIIAGITKSDDDEAEEVTPVRRSPIIPDEELVDDDVDVEEISPAKKKVPTPPSSRRMNRSRVKHMATKGSKRKLQMESLSPEKNESAAGSHESVEEVPPLSVPKKVKKRKAASKKVSKAGSQDAVQEAPPVVVPKRKKRKVASEKASSSSSEPSFQKFQSTDALCRYTKLRCRD